MAKSLNLSSVGGIAAAASSRQLEEGPVGHERHLTLGSMVRDLDWYSN
jgi:hypothetical protein